MGLIDIKCLNCGALLLLVMYESILLIYYTNHIQIYPSSHKQKTPRIINFRPMQYILLKCVIP
jgi:hypothetical protein